MKKIQKQPISFLDLPYDCIGEIIQFFKRCKDVNSFKLVRKEFYILLKERKYLHKSVLYRLYSPPTKLSFINENFNFEHIYKISIEENITSINTKEMFNKVCLFLQKLSNMKVLKIKRANYLNEFIEEIFNSLPEKIINRLERIDLSCYIIKEKLSLGEDNKFKNLKTFVIKNFYNYNSDWPSEIDTETCKTISNIKKLKVHNFFFGREHLRIFSNLEELEIQIMLFWHDNELNNTFSIFLKNLVILKLIDISVNNNFFQYFSKLQDLSLINCFNLTNEMFLYPGIQKIKKLIINCNSDKFTSEIFKYLNDLEEFITNGSNPKLFSNDYLSYYKKLKLAQFCCSKNTSRFPLKNNVKKHKCTKENSQNCNRKHLYCDNCSKENCKSSSNIMNQHTQGITSCKKCFKRIGNISKESYICHICKYLYCQNCFVAAYKKREIDYNTFSKQCCSITCYKCSKGLNDCKSCIFMKDIGKVQNISKICYDDECCNLNFCYNCENDFCNRCKEESICCSSEDCDIELINRDYLLGCNMYCFKCSNESIFVVGNATLCYICEDIFCHTCVYNCENEDCGYRICNPCFKKNNNKCRECNNEIKIKTVGN